MNKLIPLIVVTFSLITGCSRVQDNSTMLNSQHIDSCSFQGAVHKSGGKVFADISARCYIVKTDSYPNASATPVLERKNPSTGVWQVVANGTSVYKEETTQQSEYYEWNHLKAIDSCTYASDGGTFRGRVTVWERDYYGNYGQSTYYYTPVYTYKCP